MKKTISRLGKRTLSVIIAVAMIVGMLTVTGMVAMADDLCDICGEDPFGCTCIDIDVDCDYCGEPLQDCICVFCDYCGERLEHCVCEPPPVFCDYCGELLERCICEPPVICDCGEDCCDCEEGRNCGNDDTCCECPPVIVPPRPRPPATGGTEPSCECDEDCCECEGEICGDDNICCECDENDDNDNGNDDYSGNDDNEDEPTSNWPTILLGLAGLTVGGLVLGATASATTGTIASLVALLFGGGLIAWLALRNHGDCDNNRDKACNDDDAAATPCAVQPGATDTVIPIDDEAADDNAPVGAATGDGNVVVPPSTGDSLITVFVTLLLLLASGSAVVIMKKRNNA